MKNKNFVHYDDERCVEYDSNGNIAHLKYADGFECWYEYDYHGNKVHYVDSTGFEIWRDYNDKGNEVHYKDSNGYEKWTKYDDSGNLKSYEHDSNGTELFYNDGILESLTCTYNFKEYLCMSNISKVLDRIEADLSNKLGLLHKLKNNQDAIEYWEDHGDGGFWKPFTEEIAEYDSHWKLEDLRVNRMYLVDTGKEIRIVDKAEYCKHIDKWKLLQEGTLQQCKDYIKI